MESERHGIGDGRRRASVHGSSSCQISFSHHHKGSVTKSKCHHHLIVESGYAKLENAEQVVGSVQRLPRSVFDQRVGKTA